MVFVQARHFDKDHFQLPVAAGVDEILINDASRGEHVGLICGGFHRNESARQDGTSSGVGCAGSKNEQWPRVWVDGDQSLKVTRSLEFRHVASSPPPTHNPESGPH